MPLMITSLQNPKVKQVVRLREKKERQAAGLMLVEGYDELHLALQMGWKPAELYYCPLLFKNTQQQHLLGQLDANQLIEVSEAVFAKIAYRENPDGWLACLPLPNRSLEQLELSQTPFIVVAEALEKPGNLGAMLRTADAAGVDALIACDPLADWGNPNVVRASKGTLFTVPVSEGNSQAVLEWLRQQGIRSVVGTPEAALPYTQADFTQPTALIVGAEHEGVSEFWREQADLQVTIPMLGRVNSLNVSASAALLMYEVVRQRGLQ
jgi:TrmH family RNA methyltransferase